eukprot:gene13471-4350_t
MADECIIQVNNVADGEEAETTKLRMDSNLWPNLSEHLDEIDAMNFQASCYLRHKIKTDKREAIPMLAMSNFLLLCKIGFRANANILQENSVKTHAGAVESMGSYIDYQSNKRRGLDIATVGCESRIHWNGPPLHKASALIESALGRNFGGGSNWHFVTKENKHESVVVLKMKKKRSRVPWF